MGLQKDSSANVVCLRLHENLQWKSDCISLLNSEWPRSAQIRQLQVDRCCHGGQLPVALLLVDPDIKKLIGYAKICTIPAKNDICLIESVVIAKSHRRMRLGSRLMTECEEFARKAGFAGIYLTTHDQVDFYNSLGYNFCPPVCTIGGSSKLLEGEKFKNLRQSLGGIPTKIVDLETTKEVLEVSVDSSSSSVVPPPPPPPVAQKVPQIFHMSKVL